MKFSATLVKKEDVGTAKLKAKHVVISWNDLESAASEDSGRQQYCLIIMKVPNSVDLNDIHQLFDGVITEKEMKSHVNEITDQLYSSFDEFQAAQDNSVEVVDEGLQPPPQLVADYDKPIEKWEPVPEPPK